ncbi:ABC transporter ATP-binding protein [Scatolibacter rhodanostii]|uniref:ABC transporter ATP-binding protein n=1 Tax=Scatolibacter rhodanostii TaxID=2014781 RepID=UPI000C06CAF0|nr:ABC transporter ATP-binding protein [Scatolibacter rhodanostii]
MKKKSNLSRLLEYAGKFRYLTIASWVLSAISAFIALVPFLYIWKIIKEVLDYAPDFSAAQNLPRNGWMALLFAALSLLVYIMGLMCSHLAAFRIAANIRTATVHHIVTLPMGFMDGFGSGKMRKIINESSAATETYLAHQLPDKAGAMATPVGLLFLLFFFDWRLGLLSLLPIIAGFMVMMKMTGKKMQEKMKEYQNALDDMSNEAVEYVRGVPVVKTFGQTVFSFKRFKGSIDNYGKWVTEYTKSLRMPMVFYTTAVNSVFAFLIAAGLFFTQEGVTNAFLLNLIFYIIITPVISVTLTKIMFSSENAMIVNDALERIDTILEMKPLSVSKHPMHPKGTSIKIENAHFSYDGKHQAIDGITLNIEQGKSVALVGPSGGGKSTLAALIARSFDIGAGSIRIGGVDIREIEKEELMNTVAFVYQDSKLLKLSILENVRLARPTASKEEVWQALKAAQCTDIIEKMPNGVDTVIGTKGVFLSGGEQQRIAIARVMLKNAPIIILDEATAFADPDNERKVQAAFAELAKQKTVIMIAHRLTTVVDADEIFVLKEGKIAQKGPHTELLSSGGLYTDMWNNYQSSVQWKVEKEVAPC